jgi:membrane-associated protease RseP (regulator of RpoE activity)
MPGVPEVPEAPEFWTPETPNLITPRGWFGFGFQCADCSGRLADADSSAVWVFGTPPRVYSVDLGSPASRAGLRRGDVITAIDGVPIVTRDGGRRFGAIRPGQTVKWTVEREGGMLDVSARAAERPDRRARTALTDLRRELTRLNELSNLDEMRRELAGLNREMARRRAQEVEREVSRPRTEPTRRLRYAGVIGGTEVEVRGSGSIIVSEIDGKEELVITTGESVVVIRVPEAARKGSKAPPK